MKQKTNNLKEDLALQASEEIEPSPKIEQAVLLAVDCAKVLAGISPKETGTPGVLSDCFDKIMNLFLDASGDVSYPIEPDELRSQFFSQLDKQFVDSSNKIARVAKMILGKVVDKLNVFLSEKMIVDASSMLEESRPNHVTLRSIQEFENLVREMIHEAVREHMLRELKRLKLKELGGVMGSQSTDSSVSTVDTSGTGTTSGTKPGIRTQTSGENPASNIMVPGTNMNVDQALKKAGAETNFKRKADLIKKISDQIAGLKGVK